MAKEEQKTGGNTLARKYTLWYTGVNDTEVENYSDVLKPLSTFETVRNSKFIFLGGGLLVCVSASGEAG